MNKIEAQQYMNELGRQRKAFLFMLDFDLRQNKIIPLDQIDPDQLLYHIEGDTNEAFGIFPSDELKYFKKEPISFGRYKEAFEKVHKEILLGNSYLLNLTFPTEIRTNLGLKDIYLKSEALFKCWVKDQLVVFSPERFVSIQGNIIRSFPMKGTIDASLPKAKEQLLQDPKEAAEHVIIVDLIRNDLSIIARKVKVDRFRYLEHIETQSKNLWQASSEISGLLPNNWHSSIGDLFFHLLPAGSVTGAPKKKTVEIIKEAEGYERGFYTGIIGIFDGTSVNSGVMIRFVETKDGRMFYKSGGGITAKSTVEKEYQELIDKVYLPFPVQSISSFSNSIEFTGSVHP